MCVGCGKKEGDNRTCVRKKRREPNVCEKKVEGTEHVRKKETTERQLNVCEKKGRKCEKRGRQQDN